MKISATLKGQPDALGRFAIYIRVSDGKFRQTEATKYRVMPAQFLKGKVIDHPQAEIINQQLRVKIARKEIGESIKTKDESLQDYVKNLIRETEKERSFETIRQYQSELSKLSGFRKGVKMSHIDTNFLKAYSSFCYVAGNQVNTVWKSFKFLRMLVRRAVKEKVIAENPFEVFVMPKYKEPKKIYLNEDQVQTIAEKLPELGDMQFVATWFVIGCLTGLRWGDMHMFSKKNIRKKRLVIYTQKTGELVSMPISDRVEALLKSIQYMPLTVPNNRCNEILRGAMAYCEIDEPVTFHTSRHTFATLCAEKGISQEVTAKLLGHRSLRSTGIYYKITNSRIDREVEKLG